MKQVELYDIESDKLLQTVGQGQISNKLLTVRFFPDAWRMMVTGGWDTVKLWDVRQTSKTAELPGI